MLGFSTGQLLVVLGACSVMMKPSDMVKIARTAGRMTGRAVGRLIVARRQLDEILGQSAATQVHKELKDAMTQLDSIRYEVQNLSRLSPGQFMLKQHNAGMAEAGKSDSSDGPTTNQEEFRQEIRSIIRDEFEKYCRTQPIQNSVSTTEHRKLHVADEPTALKSKMANSGLTNLHNQAMTYARLSEAPGLKMDSSLSGNYKDQSKEMDGLLTVLPISAESAGLLPSRPDKPTGSDLVLEAVLEAEVAENAKLFVSQPHDQLPKE
uniref:Uncharacterized protein n=1 Tax=Zea mays TaxID=4577 RepID=C0P331_MAIZE|nr:unknown [Zea mays]